MSSCGASAPAESGLAGVAGGKRASHVQHAARVWCQPAGGGAEAQPAVEVPLIRLAWGRSGDKGDTANIGVIARRREFIPAIGAALTPQSVASYLSHLVTGPVERFGWPGLNGWSFVLRR